MLGFMVKKWFFDFWDNMLQIVLFNLVFILAVGGILWVVSATMAVPALSLVLLVILTFGFNWIMGAAALEISEIAAYKKASFAGVKANLSKVWKHSIVLTLITAIQAVVLAIAMPFYVEVGGLVGLGAMAIIFWINIIWLIASQYFYPIVAQLDTDIKKVLKKCFILFFDNTIFSIIVGIGTIAIFVVSGLTAFLLPGIGAVLLWHQVALRLRLLKYDYLEENPEANRRKIPWMALLIDERDKVGPRSLRGMIFPWKE